MTRSARWPLVLMVTLLAASNPAASAAAEPATPIKCPPNRVIVMQAPTPSAAGAYTHGAGEYPYIASADGRIVVSAAQEFAVGGNKFGFNKPDGVVATVSGRRIDGDAPPMGVGQFPKGSYPYNFEVMEVAFAAAGCWEITIEADGSRVVFHATVIEGGAAPAERCATLPEVVEGADAVFTGEVWRRQENPDGSAWVSVEFVRLIGFRSGGQGAPLGTGYGDDRATWPATGVLLFEPAGSAAELEIDGSYVVFAGGDPVRVICAARSLAAVGVDGQTLRLPPGVAPVYAARTVDDLVQEVAALP